MEMNGKKIHLKKLNIKDKTGVVYIIKQEKVSERIVFSYTEKW